MSIYEEFKRRFDSIYDGFEALLDEAEEFNAWIDKAIEGLEASPAPNEQLIGRLKNGPQRRELKNFIEALDDPAADALRRMYERLNILQLAEKGDFV